MATENTPPTDDGASSQADREPDRLAQPVDDEQPPRLPFPVIGIGASAGGLEAVSEFLQAMRPDGGMAFVLVQHLAPDRESQMAEILARHTAMPVTEIADGMAVEPDHVYVIRPGHVLTIRAGRLRLGPALGTPRAANRPIDDFFRSLAAEQRARAVCVVLSGMGSNGTAGAQAVKAAGGLCVAQDPETAEFPSMPRHLIDAGYADCVLCPADIPEMLLGYAGHPYARGGRESDAGATLQREGDHLREVLALLRTRTHQDFSGYKKPTLLRRVQRRMVLTGTATVAEYARLLRQTTAEAAVLADDLLIHVTGFFRDPDAWEALRRDVVTPMVAARAPGGSIRAWVTACSSGEEAYSLAMLLVEEAERAGKPLDIEIFATDLAERSLAHARAGVYPGGIESDVTPERLGRFFTQDDAVYRVRAELRERMVFAAQNMLQDPPFTRLDIVCCRNLLIYLEPELQQRVLALLHFGLVESGALFLGGAETAIGADDLFEPINKQARIFRRVGPTRHGLAEFALPRAISCRGESEGRLLARPGRAGATRLSIEQLTQRTLLKGHTPPAVTVDREHRVIYFHGDTRAFLQQPHGEPTRDLMLLAREGVRGAVRVALHRAAAQAERVTVLDAWAEVEPGRRARIAVIASPIAPELAPDEKAGPAEYFVISFEERGESAAPAAGEPVQPGTESADELRRLRAELQRTVAELQTSNEELRASNEEVMSINEEFKAANEELETSREEMQSLNEELTAVNAQLRAKVEEHLATNNDLACLLSSTDIAVLFLDPALRIRRYTAAIRDLMDLITGDVGRPLAALARRFDDPYLDDDARAVLERLVPIEREIPAANGRHYLRRILPYRTTDNRIDGVVVTFIDISARKNAEQALRSSEEQLRRAVEEAPIPVIMQAEDGQVLQISRSWTDLTGYTLSDVPTLDAWLTRAYGPGADAVRAHMHELFRGGRKVLGVEFTLRTRGGAERYWSFSASAPGTLRDGRRFVVGMAVDMTERRQIEAAVKAGEAKLQQILNTPVVGVLILDQTGTLIDANNAFLQLSGYSRAEIESRSLTWRKMTPPEDVEESERQMEAVARTGRIGPYEKEYVRKDGSRNWILLAGASLGDGTIVMFAIDIADRKRLEDELRRSRDELEVRVQQRTAELRRVHERAVQSERLAAVGEALAVLSHEGRNALQRAHGCLARLGYRLEGKPEEEDLAGRTRQALEDLQRLFDDIRGYAGPVVLDVRACDLREVWREAWSQALVQHPGRDAQLDEELGGARLACEADPFRLGQAFRNFFANALDACPDPARVAVSCQEVQLGDRPALHIRVRDNGPGFAPEQREHAFEAFRTTKAKGTGLGLAIAKRVVEAHGGTIAVEDSAGGGATIGLVLPRKHG